MHVVIHPRASMVTDHQVPTQTGLMVGYVMADERIMDHLGIIPIMKSEKDLENCSRAREGCCVPTGLADVARR